MEGSPGKRKDSNEQRWPGLQQIQFAWVRQLLYRSATGTASGACLPDDAPTAVATDGCGDFDNQGGGGSWLLSFSAEVRRTGRQRSSSSRRETREACELTFIAATTVPTT